MLKLHAGVSKKVGLPGFSSASASCTIEAELDSSLLQDHEGFQIVVQRAYQSCEQVKASGFGVGGENHLEPAALTGPRQ
jgi:hypothetical protein